MAANGNDVDKLVVLSGHTDKQTLWDHYYRATTKHEAERFWSIVPPDHVRTNIVSFPVAQP